MFPLIKKGISGSARKLLQMPVVSLIVAYWPVAPCHLLDGCRQFGLHFAVNHYSAIVSSDCFMF